MAKHAVIGREVVATPGALQALAEAGLSDGREYLFRHAFGDWGEMDAEDKAKNDEMRKAGSGMLMSSYKLSTGTEIWIITEADRSVTTILLPIEY